MIYREGEEYTKHLCILVPAPLWHLSCIIFSLVVPILQFFRASCIKFGARLASIFYKLMQKQHLLMVLIGTNLLFNISTKATKTAPYLMPD